MSIQKIDIKEYNRIVTENEKLKNRMNLIMSVYPIKIEEHKDYFKVKSPEIDSALLLLPHYRNMLKYNGKEKSWSIKIVR